MKLMRFNKFIAGIPTFLETNAPFLLHQRIQTGFKLKKPSPIMEELLDPATNLPANEETKLTLLNKYLINKFEKATPLQEVSYPEEFIPDIDTIEYLRKGADLRKTTGYDFIPYQALKYEQFRIIVARDLRHMLVNNTKT